MRMYFGNYSDDVTIKNGLKMKLKEKKRTLQIFD